MKQRLLEMGEFCDPDEAETVRLLRSLSPAAVSEIAEKRVYASVCVRRSRGPRLARLAVLVTSLLVSSTILCATLARRWLASSDQKSSGSIALGLPAVQPRHSAARQGPEVRPSPADGIPTSLAATTADLVASAPAPRVGIHRDRPRAALAGKRVAVASGGPPASVEESSPKEMAPAPAPPEEAALVMAALRSLRREHNPAQASALSRSYLTRFPAGVLIEEALAISIEAALARQDVPAAAALANQYLGRYPAGRFVGLARKTASTRP